MAYMIVLKVKLLQHEQINVVHVPLIGLALVSTIFGISTTTATVK